MTRILVVDDEPLSAEETAEALETAGFQTQWCSDPHQALSLASDPGIGIMVTDLRMPGMDGDHLIAAVTARRPDMRFVIISGHEDAADAPPPDQGTILARLRKPVSMAGLISLLSGMLPH